MTEERLSYYASGSTELAVDTPLTIKKLEKRRKLTKNSNRLVIVLVGLPARGKSFVARKLKNFLTWSGNRCRIFNVGKYRREAHAALLASSATFDVGNDKDNEREKVGSCDANFFDSNNSQAALLREKVAGEAMKDMLRWLDLPSDDGYGDETDSLENDCARVVSDEDMEAHLSFCSASTLGSVNRDSADRIAIFDATNSTAKRRKWILEECTSPEKRQGKPPTGVVFVESLCDDEELLEENFRFKIANSPDFQGLTPEEAEKDLRKRVQKYEEQYETITDDSLSYIKIYNLSTKLLVNHIYGRMSKMIVPALMAWHIGTRPVFLCRAGQTLMGAANSTSSTASDSDESEGKEEKIENSYFPQENTRKRYSLGPTGKKFSDSLYRFCEQEGANFRMRRSSIMDNKRTGTSLTGLLDPEYTTGEYNPEETEFPIKIFASTMPRTFQTVAWENYDFQVNQISSLNPLDKGDFEGMELDQIRDHNPGWYSKLKRKPFHTRFPGGESYCDLVNRLSPVVIDIEQQVVPTLVVSHISTLQVLIAYFRNTPVEKCVSIEVPLHTVLKFDPVRGGGWVESRFPLGEIDASNLPRVSSDSDCSALTAEENSGTPFWGDHVRTQTSQQLCVPNF